MTRINVKLNSVDDVKEFVSIAGKFATDLDLAHGKYVIDAKSIMGIFSLDLSTPLELTINSENTSEIEKITEAFKPFRV